MQQNVTASESFTPPPDPDIDPAPQVTVLFSAMPPRFEELTPSWKQPPGVDAIPVAKQPVPLWFVSEVPHPPPLGVPEQEHVRLSETDLYETKRAG